MDEAESTFHQVLSLAKVISNPTQLWKTCFSMGKFYGAIGKDEQALVSYRAARDIVDPIKSGLQTPDQRSCFEHSSLIIAVIDLSNSF